MGHDVEDLVQKFKADGLQAEAKQFLSRYPDSPKHLTEKELREQIMYFPIEEMSAPIKKSA